MFGPDHVVAVVDVLHIQRIGEEFLPEDAPGRYSSLDA